MELVLKYQDPDGQFTVKAKGNKIEVKYWDGERISWRGTRLFCVRDF
jgi:hypothetical protein